MIQRKLLAVEALVERQESAGVRIIANINVLNDHGWRCILDTIVNRPSVARRKRRTEESSHGEQSKVLWREEVGRGCVLLETVEIAALVRELLSRQLRKSRCNDARRNVRLANDRSRKVCSNVSANNGNAI